MTYDVERDWQQLHPTTARLVPGARVLVRAEPGRPLERRRAGEHGSAATVERVERDGRSRVVHTDRGPVRCSPAAEWTAACAECGDRAEEAGDGGAGGRCWDHGGLSGYHRGLPDTNAARVANGLEPWPVPAAVAARLAARDRAAATPAPVDLTAADEPAAGGWHVAPPAKQVTKHGRCDVCGRSYARMRTFGARPEDRATPYHQLVRELAARAREWKAAPVRHETCQPAPAPAAEPVQLALPLDVEPAAPARPDVVVIPCGGAKLDRPAPAGQLYTGSYHAACRRTADALQPARVLILSALHGLVELDAELAPYDVRMGQPGSVTAEQLAEQAERLGVAGARSVVALAGQSYAEPLRAVWPALVEPLRGSRGIGEQLGRMARIRAAGAL